MNVTDPRLTAFCSNSHPELFHAIVHRHEIFRHDIMDVPEVHEEARAAFARVMNSVGAGLHYGKILLLLGEAGSGKTHLMRAFRSEVTRKASGYFTYMQMTSSEANYEQYVLTNIIDSLNQPYDDDISEQTALRRLSNSLVEDRDLFEPGALQFLREGELNLPWVFEYSDYLIARLKVQNIHPDLLRVLLLLQRDEPELKNLILQYLRCRPLSDYDLRKLGGIAPLHGDGGPREVIRSLAALAWALEQSTFVVCLDQLEGMYELNLPVQTRFLSAMRIVCELTDAVPSMVVVVSCLEDFYSHLKPSLTNSLLDRIETSPEPVRLAGRRSAAEVEKIITRRLEHLFDDSDADIVASEPLYPFAGNLPEKLQGFRARKVLDLCREARARSQQDGQRPVVANTDAGDIGGATGKVSPVISEGLVLEQLWNDHYTSYSEPLPQHEAEMTGLLASALTHAANELPGKGWLVKASAGGDQVATQLENSGRVISRTLVTLCNQKAQGGALGNAVVAARERAINQDRRCVIVRTTSFPESPRTVIAKKLGELIAEGGARTIVEDSDWRAMAAMQTFVARHGSRQGFAEWLLSETPLTKLRPVSMILNLHNLPAAPAVPAVLSGSTGRVDAEPDKTTPTEPAPASLVIQPAGRSWLGMTKELSPSPVTIDNAELTRHTAFLGGSGSGKTTLALNLIESLLLSGVPAVLIDRKGDLCSYASETAWQQPLPSPEAEARRAKLRESIEVSLYTPGRDDGRPLCLPMIPDGLADMKPADRDIAAKHTAGALAG
ncbi:AAA family ATPase [Verrucomicrobium spinosum]|nr:AAA family ATPase [Verrucomicrobium spinosum]